MLFLENWFWVFLAVVLPVYWLTPGPLKLYALVGASAVFHYHFAGPAGMAPIIALAIATYFVGQRISAPGQRRLFHASWIGLVAVLGFYKYGELMLHAVGELLGAILGRDAGLLLSSAPQWLAGWQNPAAPLGVSFFTFEFVHYLYEVRVHGREPVRNPFHFAAFAIFFPSLASGPIKRFNDFVPQLLGLHNPNGSTAILGIRRIIHGLFKKVCIADTLVIFILPLEETQAHTALSVTLLAVLQGFRIYYDFSGYTDIAIGAARLLNIELPENFDRPYWSSSLRDFWRRWHMSLSSWIRDYLYVPLGGNRAHRALNLVVALALCGLWHGAAWNFAVWGLYHGVGLALEAGVRGRFPGLLRNTPARRLLGWAVCYPYVTFGWLLFFYPIGVVARMLGDVLQW